MTKYRIKKETSADGTILYYVQYKNFLFWHTEIEFISPTATIPIMYGSIEEAKYAIDKHIKSDMLKIIKSKEFINYP